MTRVWGEREAGSRVMQSKDDPTMLVLGDVTVGDVVRVPEDVPEAGGSIQRVEDVQVVDCPKCRENLVLVYLLEQAGLRVAECRQCGFVWHRVKVPHS